MIKHILTTKCFKKCSYCITRNVNIKEYDAPDCLYIDKLVDLYFQLIKFNKQIMFTGGEPTLSRHLFDAWHAARIIFNEVYITSANPQVLQEHKSAFRFNAIVYSMHEVKAENIYEVENGAKVFCSIMSDQYKEGLPETLKKFGYAGLTINENHFGTEIFDETLLPEIDNFSIKINRHGECFKKDTIYILPDLTVTNNFEEFLK